MFKNVYEHMHLDVFMSQEISKIRVSSFDNVKCVIFNTDKDSSHMLHLFKNGNVMVGFKR